MAFTIRTPAFLTTSLFYMQPTFHPHLLLSFLLAILRWRGDKHGGSALCIRVPWCSKVDAMMADLQSARRAAEKLRGRWLRRSRITCAMAMLQQLSRQNVSA